MNIVQDKILIMADKKSTAIIETCAKLFPDLKILTAASENKAFELIYDHALVLVIIDNTLPFIEPYKIGSMLLSHKQIHNTPLLILCDTVPQDNFLTDFDNLQIDHLIKPFTSQQIQAKIKIFFELFKQKDAVHQSIDELDRVYQKVIAMHEQSNQKNTDAKVISTKAAIAASQIQESLRSLQGSIYQLLRKKEITPEVKSKLSSIKTASEKISIVTKKLTSFLNYSKTTAPDQARQILYAQGSDEDFSIFSHFMKGVANCNLCQSKSMEQSLELISRHEFDLILIDYLQPEGTGFDLLSKLNRMRSDIPVIFTLDKSHAHQGSEAVSKGAFTYFIKEELSCANMNSIINNTLEKASLTREVEEAQGRIVMISKKDYLTKLNNRRCFELELESELSKAKRYRTDLSILLLDFDNFRTINDTHGYDTGDRILATSATIIQSMVRDNDVVCRYGGEEFGIVLANTPVSGARMLADRIRKKMAGYEFSTQTDELKLTVSIGVTSFDGTITTYSDLVRNGLDALALAMEQGGNTVKTHTSKA